MAGAQARAGDLRARPWAALRNEIPALLLIAGLLLLGAEIVYLTGGTGYAFPYVELIPVMVAVKRYRVYGGIAVAVVGAVLLGPLMPLDVEREIAQSTANWVARLGFFVLLGGFTGWLFDRARRQQAEGDRLARQDRPTGLGNRAALEEQLDRTVTAPATGRPGHPVVYIVRITDFVDALNAIGFEAADELVGAVARMIEQEVPEAGVPYRFSAAELAFLAEQIETDQAEVVAARIKAAGDRPVNVKGVAVRVELCVGGAEIRLDETDRRYEPLRRAYLALFTAEERYAGYGLYNEQYERSSQETFRLITRVRDALDAGHFELFYQPKVRLADGAVVGAEALIRWHDPEIGYIAPDLFIPKVERTSLIAPVTRFAFHQACEFAKAHPDLTVGVNLSARNLYDDALLEELCETLGGLGALASSLEIEITERTIAHDPAFVSERIERLRRYGVAVSIDDFGTGYSSFAYLHRLPITGLKIDRSFLVEQANDPRARGIVQCIVGAGRELGLEVVAEGVETPSQLQTVRDLGCHMAQGFYFAHPQPAPEFDKWLANRSTV